jgi:3'(2'), 5'-bisphosphate nucleotidase
LSDPTNGVTDDELERLLAIGREAANRVMAVRRGGDLALELKGPDDPVTRADKLANAYIVAELARLFPDAGIVAEESAPAPEALAALVARDRVFFVDPVDGTREFAQGLPEFAVMIGLAVRGSAVAGVVVIPAEGVALAGRVGGGAFSELLEGGTRSELRPSGVSEGRGATVVVSRSHRPPELGPILERLGIARELPCGSVGVKVARVAMAKADLYIHPGRGAKKWDACAPEALIRAAGGDLTDVFGRRIDYAEAELGVLRGMCASNGRLHDAATAAAREALGAIA